MNTLNNKPQTNTTKKTWCDPELHIIASANVNGGAASGIHEASITHSIVAKAPNNAPFPGHYWLYKGNSVAYNYQWATHTKNFYNS